jgi:hypothetical protein
MSSWHSEISLLVEEPYLGVEDKEARTWFLAPLTDFYKVQQRNNPRQNAEVNHTQDLQ